MALSEWADAQPEPWATVLRFVPIAGAFLLGLILVLLWKRKPVPAGPKEAMQAIVPQAKSPADEELPLVQSELKASLEKNKRQKEQIASAGHAIEIKDQELDELRVKLSESASKVEDLSDTHSGIESTTSEDLEQVAAPIQEETSSEDELEKSLLEWDELLVFRSNDPSIWNQSVSDGEDRCAILLSEVPDNVAWLRMRRLDTGEGVVIPVQTGDLTQDGGDRSSGFNGSNEEFYGARHLGLYGEDLPQEVETRFAYGGWGFGHRANGETTQAKAWAGQEINGDTVLEITVFPSSPEVTDSDQLIESS